MLLPEPSLNLFTSISMSSSNTVLQTSRWIFRIPREFSLFSVIVDCTLPDSPSSLLSFHSDLGSNIPTIDPHILMILMILKLYL